MPNGTPIGILVGIPIGTPIGISIEVPSVSNHKGLSWAYGEALSKWQFAISHNVQDCKLLSRTWTHFRQFDSLQISLACHTTVPAVMPPPQILFLFYRIYDITNIRHLACVGNLIGRFGRLLILLRSQRPRRSQSGSAEYLPMRNAYIL